MEIKPQGSEVFVVRWATDNGHVRGRFFLREASARKYANRLMLEHGKMVAMFVIEGEWTIVRPKGTPGPDAYRSRPRQRGEQGW